MFPFFLSLKNSPSLLTCCFSLDPDVQIINRYNREVTGSFPFPVGSRRLRIKQDVAVVKVGVYGNCGRQLQTLLKRNLMRLRALLGLI